MLKLNTRSLLRLVPSSRLSWGLLSLTLLILTTAAHELVPHTFQPVPLNEFVTVEQGHFELLLSQSGTVESSNNSPLINRCEYSTRILTIVPEGTWVEAGDIVMQLDASTIEEEARVQAIDVVRAEKYLKDGEEDVRIQELTNASRIAAAELAATLARLESDGYVAAEYPQLLHESESAAVLAAEELNRAQKQYAFVGDMVRLGYRTASELENERLKWLKARQARELAQGKVDVLQKFTFQRNSLELSALAQESVLELERTKALAKNALRSRQMRLQSRRRTYELELETLNHMKANIAACTIRAPRAGEVVLGKGSSGTVLQEGSSVWNLQTLAMIPDRDKMQLSLRVHESRIRLLELGQLATVTVDAFPHEQLTGRVVSLSTVPLSGSFPNYDLREYKVVVELQAAPEALRKVAPGMTAQAAIRAADIPAAIKIPLSAFVQIGDQHGVFLRQGADVTFQPIEVGHTGDQEQEVRSGLNVGDQIVRQPRIACADRILAREAGLVN